MNKAMQSEPAITIGTITTIAVAIIALLVAFGVNLSQPQQAAILGVVAVLAPFIVALVTRFFVWAPDSVEAAQRQARADGYEKALTDVTPPAPAPPPPVSAPQQAMPTN